MDFVGQFPQKNIFRNVLKSKRLCLYLIISFAKTLFQKYHQPIKNSRNLLQSPRSSRKYKDISTTKQIDICNALYRFGRPHG
jgi:hypothetical protein